MENRIVLNGMEITFAFNARSIIDRNHLRKIVFTTDFPRIG